MGMAVSTAEAANGPPGAIVDSSAVAWVNRTTGVVSTWHVSLNNSGTVTEYQDLNHKCSPNAGCSTQWRPIGIGDMNGDGRDDVIEWNPASASIPVCFSTDHGWACENLAASYVGGIGAGNMGSGVYAGGKAFVADTAI